MTSTDLAPMLPGFDPPTRAESTGERIVREAIAAIDAAEGGMSPSHLVIASTCLALARNIESGNQKGRAIANEAAQLVAMMQLLAGDDVEAPTSNLPEETQRVFDALATAPRLDTPSASYAAQL